MKSLLLEGFWTQITDFITGFFALIPQFMYFFYTCIASLVDLCQVLMRKLAGLDAYYVNGAEVEGDVLSSIVNNILGLNGTYSALTTVFWSLVIFGVIVLIITVIISIIKSQYNYDSKKSHPKFIIGQALKALANFAVVPICVIFGILLSNVLLQALDDITSQSSDAKLEQIYASSSASYNTYFSASEGENERLTYYSFDFFGSNIPTAHQTFSGMIFQSAAYECNRVRYGGFSAEKAGDAWSDLGIFNSNLSSDDEKTEAVASMIDFAFANNLKTVERHTASVLKSESALLISSFRYLQSAVWYLGTINFNNFSKYNVGLVWYYYNLWSFNFLVGFVAIIFALSIMGSIVLGLMARIVECVALFLVYGPVIGVTPLDNGSAYKSWKKTFIEDVLLAFSSVIGFNLLFLFLPYFQAISFFSASKPVLNYIMNTIVILILLSAIKSLIGLLSSFTGGGDATNKGSSVKSELGKPLKSAIGKTATLAVVGAKVMKFIPGLNAVGGAISKLSKKVSDKFKQYAKNRAAGGKTTPVSQSIYDNILGENQKEQENLENENKNLKDELAKETKSEDDYRKAEADEMAAADRDNVAATGARAREDSYREKANRFEAELDDINRQIADKERELRMAVDLAEKRRLGAEIRNLTRRKNNRTSDRDVYRSLQESAKRHAEKFEASMTHHREQAAFFGGQADRLREINDKIAGNESRIEALKQEREAMPDRYKVVDSPHNRKILKDTVNIGGQVIRTAGSVIGFNEFFKALKSETEAIDSAKIVFRDFAQTVLGRDVSQKKTFITSKEAEKVEKSEKKQRKTLSLHTVSDSMRRQAEALSQALRDIKK